MKVKLSVALAVVGSVLMLYSLYVPWLSFNGLIRKYDDAYEVSGSIYGLGIGTLNRTSAKVTVWSGEHWSSAGSDFWFGWFSVVGGLLIFVFAFVFMKVNKPLILTLLVLICGILPIPALMLATVYYQPQTFVIDGQIDDYPIDAGIVRAADAVINVGMGPWISLAGGVLSIISMTSAYYFRSKQRR